MAASKIDTVANYLVIF